MSDASLALSRTFLEQLQKMPPKVHKKVLSFIDSFRADPRAATHHVEPIQTFKDSRARTARIGDDYRAVLVAPKTGTQFLLVYIDHHDEAMRWAENKTFDVHPVLGSLQIVDAQSATQAVTPAAEVHASGEAAAPGPSTPAPGAAFQHLSDDDLVSLGLPAPLIPAVRQVADAEAFRRLAPHLPEESREALEWVAVAGGSFTEAKELVKAAERPPEDVDDYGPALEQADTQRRFVSVRSADELEAMLRGPLHAWRIFLHPDQRALVAPKHEYKGPLRVLGGAGTGKTVVAMHRAKYLADKVFTAPGDRVLFTTFSRNLALSVRQNMILLCDGEEHRRIEVRSIDSWAATYLRPFDIKFKLANEKIAQRLWQETIALAGLDRFTEGFCRQEWEQVVQAQDVKDEATYLRVPRKGRGGRLSRDDRKFLWSLFATYRELLEREGMHEYTDMIRAARKHLQASGAPPPYKAVVVDETQDFDTEKLKLVRALAAEGSSDLFLVGDAHQRIYTHPTTLSSCGIDIRGRGKRLRVNYRTTHEIRQFAVGILHGTEVDDLDGGQDDLKGYTSVLSGPPPEVRWSESEADETAAVVARVTELRERTNNGRGICIIAPSRHRVEKVYGSALADAGIETRIVDRDDELADEPGVRLCTMHRAKGLEFEHVIIAGLGDARFPRPIDDGLADDAIAAQQHTSGQHSLLFVAATRARDTLTVAGWGAARWLAGAPFQAGAHTKGWHE